MIIINTCLLSTRQTILVSKILKDVYKEKPQYARNIAFPAMQTAFRITCEVDFRTVFPMLSNTNNASSSGMKNNDASVSSQAFDTKLTNSDVLDVIKDILYYLLKSKPVMISIMNIHFIDERSAKALLYISNIECRSVFVFSSGSIDEKFIYPMFHKTAYLLKPNVSSTINNNTQEIINSRSYLTWFSSTRESFFANNSTTVIYLDDLSLADIEKKLRTALEDGAENYLDIDDKIIEKVVDMINKFSGKKLFWIQQCIFLIKKTGIHVFIKIIEQSLSEVSLHEEEHVQLSPEQMLPSAANEMNMEEKLAATASLFIESKSSFSSSVSKNTVLSDGMKFKHLITARYTY